MTRPPIRMIFLGNRRIAWEALKLLSSEAYQSRIDVRVLVTDSLIYEQYQSLHPQHRAIYISNDKRQSEKIAQTIKDESIDVLLSVQYNWIIPGYILNMVGRRAFNLHNARLPAYKGYNSISHAIANSDRSYETTIHWMADEVDCGDVAFITKTPIEADDTASSLYLRTVGAAASAVQSLLNDLVECREIPRTPMSAGQGVFYRRDSVEALSNLTDMVSPEQLALIARAAYFPPINAAHFFYAGRKYLIVPEDDGSKILVSGKAVNEPNFD